MRILTITAADIARCPKRILAPTHWRGDGTCWCSEDAPTSQTD